MPSVSATPDAADYIREKAMSLSTSSWLKEEKTNVSGR